MKRVELGFANLQVEFVDRELALKKIEEWAWNMPREGFRQLYEQIPGGKPGFEEVWRIAGGNPRVLEELYGAGWSFERLLRGFIARRYLRGFVSSLSPSERELLARALEDPDALASR